MYQRNHLYLNLTLFCLLTQGVAYCQPCDSAHKTTIISSSASTLAISSVLPWQEGAAMLGVSTHNTGSDQVQSPLFMTAQSDGSINRAVIYESNGAVINFISLAAARDGNFWVGGNYNLSAVSSNTTGGLLLAKVRPDGSLIWSRGLNGNYNQTRDLLVTDKVLEVDDGDIVLSVIRLSQKTYPLSDWYNIIMRLAPDGTLRWSRKLVSPTFKPSNQTIGNGSANGLIQLGNGDLAFSALLDNNFQGLSTSAAYYFARLDYASGVLKWNRTYLIPPDLQYSASIVHMSEMPDGDGFSLIGYVGNRPASIAVTAAGGLRYAVAYTVQGDEAADNLYLNGAVAKREDNIRALSVTDATAAKSVLFSIDVNGHVIGYKGASLTEGSNGHNALAITSQGNFYLTYKHFTGFSNLSDWKTRFIKTDDSFFVNCFDTDAMIEEKNVADDLIEGDAGIRHTDAGLKSYISFPLVAKDFAVMVTAGCTNSECPELPPVTPTPPTSLHPVTLPSAFTPNSDGRNDIFRAGYNNSYHFIRLSVYNRFGKMVFTTSTPTTGWDGTANGIAQPTGVYIYRLELETSSAQKLSQKGTVVLLR